MTAHYNLHHYLYLIYIIIGNPIVIIGVVKRSKKLTNEPDKNNIKNKNYFTYYGLEELLDLADRNGVNKVGPLFCFG